jgi:hypothetical protein
MSVYPVVKENFTPIDPIIDEWVKRNRLFLFKEYRECAVRSVELCDRMGSRRVQIWIDPVKDGTTTVNVWEIRPRYREVSRGTKLVTGPEGLAKALDEALELASTLLS